MNFDHVIQEMSKQATSFIICFGTFLEAALDAVCDGHPSLRDKLVQYPCGHCRLKPIQCPLSGLSTEKTGTQTSIIAIILMFSSSISTQPNIIKSMC